MGTVVWGCPGGSLSSVTVDRRCNNFFPKEETEAVGEGKDGAVVLNGRECEKERRYRQD